MKITVANRTAAFRAVGNSFLSTMKRARSLPLLIAVLGLSAWMSVVSGCGSPPSAEGTWSGEMEITQGGERLPVELDLLLEQSEDGLLTGSGTVTIRTPGETDALDFGNLRGRMQEDGSLRLEASEEALLSERGLEMEGEVSGDTMDGEATLATAVVLDEPRRFSGGFELERQGQ